MVYPHLLVRPLGKYKGIDNKKHFKVFLDEIKENNIKIEQFCGDNLKRSFARDALSHSSNYPCEYCFSKGVSIIVNSTDIDGKEDLDIEIALIDEKIRNTEDNNEKLKLTRLKEKLKKRNAGKRKRSKITWPASTASGEPRTVQKILDIVENLDNLGPEERKGITGRSLFLDIPNFNMVLDMPTEYLHSTCLGVVKKLVILTFSVGETKPRNTKRKLSKPECFNVIMSKVKTAREFPRRARDLDFSVLKGSEFRNIAIFYFVIVLECIEIGQGERKLWLYLAYMIRSCIVPSEEFRYVNLEDVEWCCKHFYELYEKLFGCINCTYNTHVVCSHLLEMRKHGPLTETSAFIFESFYGEMRRAFVPGTVSPLKQI